MTVSAIRARFTRQKFQAFLDAQPPRKLAGRVAQACHCPLSVYLGKHSDHKVFVGADTWKVLGTKTGLKNLPRWARDFISEVDATKMDGQISYSRAAKILRSL